MPSYQHKALLKKICRLNQAPSDSVSYERWITAQDQLDFLDSNSQDDELILYAVGTNFFVHGVAIKKDLLFPLDKSDLVWWSGNPYGSRAAYMSENNSIEIWIEENYWLHGSRTIEKAQQLVFMRSFEDLNENSTYCEILQEFSHLSRIHWRNEFSSYCYFDENGDFDQVVSVTIRDGFDEVALVSVQREPLELFLAASDSIMIRMFEFTCSPSDEFVAWSDEPEEQYLENEELFYRQKIESKKAGYTRGIQIVPLSRPRSEIFSLHHD